MLRATETETVAAVRRNTVRAAAQRQPTASVDCDEVIKWRRDGAHCRKRFIPHSDVAEWRCKAGQRRRVCAVTGVTWRWLTKSRSQHLTSSGSHLSDDGNRRYRTVRACRCDASDTVIVTGCGCCTYVHSIAVTGWQLLWTCFFYRLVTCCYWSLTGAVDHLQGAPKN